MVNNDFEQKNFENDEFNKMLDYAPV